MLLGIVVERGHPVILYGLSREIPVLHPGFRVVERGAHGEGCDRIQAIGCRRLTRAETRRRGENGLMGLPRAGRGDGSGRNGVWRERPRRGRMFMCP